MTATEFGRAMRRWRDQVSPTAAGLPVGGARRAPGLRREELAHLAGISVDYVTRLEQGRATHPSDQVVEALGRALRLSGPDREHLFQLAGLMPPGRGTVPGHITPSVHRMLDRLSTTPVAVSDAAWNMLLSNPLHRALMGERTGKDRNTVWRTFLGSVGWVDYSAADRRDLEIVQVTELRAAAKKYPADRRLHGLIAELRSDSPRFAELWDSGVIGRTFPPRKTIEHPRVGRVTVDCDMLEVSGSDLRIVVYTAEPGSRDAERLELLSVVGTQDLTV